VDAVAYTPQGFSSDDIIAEYTDVSKDWEGAKRLTIGPELPTPSVKSSGGDRWSCLFCQYELAIGDVRIHQVGSIHYDTIDDPC
jgi:hypothetical protein